MLLNNIALFLQIVEKGSLTAAGREAGLSCDNGIRATCCA